MASKTPASTYGCDENRKMHCARVQAAREGHLQLLQACSLLLCQGAERSKNLLVQSNIQHFSEVLLWQARHLKFHVRNLLDEPLHCQSDDVPSDFRLASGLRHHLLCRLVKTDNDLHHTPC